VHVVVPATERCLDEIMQVGKCAIGNPNPPPDRWLNVKQGDFELVKYGPLLRGRLPDRRRSALEHFCMILGKQVSDFMKNSHESLLVGAGSVQGRLAKFVVQVVQFLLR
jgi:hypothetical protein